MRLYYVLATHAVWACLLPMLWWKTTILWWRSRPGGPHHRALMTELDARRLSHTPSAETKH